MSKDRYSCGAVPGYIHKEQCIKTLNQFSSVAQSCPALCNPMDCSTPGSLSITSSWSLLELMPKLLYLGWINNKVLQYNTGNST